MIRRTLIFGLFLALSSTAFGQSDYSIRIKPRPWAGFPGLQSFAHSSWEGEWLLLAGRTDGLHQRQPFAAFDQAGQNGSLYVTDPATDSVWQQDLSSLPQPVQEQFRGTNLNFWQEDSFLVLVGGYGYQASANDHLTSWLLTVVNVPGAIDAIKSGQSLTPHVHYVQNEFFAVTGGHLAMLDSTYYLVGGHRFDGRYNPMGHPSYVQTYTEAIRKFWWADNAGQLIWGIDTAISDPVHLHRRDYNLLPQVLADGSSGLTIFSGVFQVGVDLPFLSLVDIRPNSHSVVNGFEQYLNHYHSAKVALYDSVANEMHNLFFGGMSQYFLDPNEQLIQDDNVPFVTTIGRVRRMADGSWIEDKLGDLPARLGAGAEFLPHPDLATESTILRLDQLAADSVLLGWIVGGIESSADNVFWSNTGAQSWASAQVLEVWLDRSGPGTSIRVPQPEEIRQFLVTPNPAEDRLRLEINVASGGAGQLWLQNAQGQIVWDQRIGTLRPGAVTRELPLPELASGMYLLTLRVGNHSSTQKLMIGR